MYNKVAAVLIHIYSYVFMYNIAKSHRLYNKVGEPY